MFAIFTIFRGMLLLGLLTNRRLRNIVDDYNTLYMLYAILGIYLILFYGIILYTSIGKGLRDEKELLTYKLIGMGTGIFFLITLVFTYLLHNYTRCTKKKVFGLGILFLILVGIMLKIVVDCFEKIKQMRTEVLTLIMIPFNAI